MLLESYRLIPYRLPLEPPFRWRGGEIAEREGVLLRLETIDGRVGWGDASPLPGFSSETLAASSQTLESIAESLIGHDVDARSVADPTSALHGALDALAPAASARYAIDLALAELAASERGISLPRFFHAGAADVLPLAALLDGPPETIVDTAGARADEGYRALKLKAGRLDPESDAEIVRDVRRRVGSHVELRVDANRAWTPDQAAAFADRVGVADVAYVEEPLDVAHLADLATFARESGMRVALDESLGETGGEDLVAGWVTALVLKPTVIGGIAATLRWVERARTVGARAVLSAAFESGVGQRGVAALAAATGAEPAGLDPYRRLQEDVLGRRLPFDGPIVDVAALFAQRVDVREPAPAG